MATPHSGKRRGTRSVRKTFRLSEEELARVAKFSEKTGVAVSTLARTSLMDVVRGETVPTALREASGAHQMKASLPGEWREELRELRVAMNRLGVNLNQLTRLAHEESLLEVLTEGEAAHEAVRLIRALAVYVRNALEIKNDVLTAVRDAEGA